MMRDKIAKIISDDVDAHLNSGIPWDGTKAADAFIAALPGMIPDLVWKGSHFAYCTLPFCQYQVREAEDGFYVQADGYRSQVIGSQYAAIEQAKAVANAHHKAQVMAALGLETSP